MKVLGVHFGHDANAALVVDGKVVADVAEERFNRLKHSSDAPIQSVEYCLKQAGITAGQLDGIAVSGINGHPDFASVFKRNGQGTNTPVYHCLQPLSSTTEIRCYDHHQCHAAGAYFLSGIREKALILVSDGFGDDCSVSVWQGQNSQLELIQKYPKEGSLGWFYSNVTEALGWIHGDGEGKTMALASYGNRTSALNALLPFIPKYHNGELVEMRDFGDVHPLTLRSSVQWHLKDAGNIKCLSGAYAPTDIAAAAQWLVEEQHLQLAEYWLDQAGTHNLCLSGGVFLNIVLNRKLADMERCHRLFASPNPSDAGLALGAALNWIAETDEEALPGCIETPYTGPDFSDDSVVRYLKQKKLSFEQLDSSTLIETCAEALHQNQCLGWFQGRMECGPRALGNRSIIMNATHRENMDYINDHVKFREPFRPFCPSLIVEDRKRYLKQSEDGQYMILAFDAPETIREKIPAVVHHDGSIRPQVVTPEKNRLYHQLITKVKELTGEGIVLNTSFNIKGEPIVASPADAVRCFFSTGMDVLALGHCLLRK